LNGDNHIQIVDN
jgi:hypothetical protein